MRYKPFWEAWMENDAEREATLREYISLNKIRKEIQTDELIKGHLEKADHNLRFVKATIDLKEFNDWAIVSAYYAIYHASLALCSLKMYSTKDHNATLLILNPKKNEQVTEKADEIYAALNQAGIEVLLDDRDARPCFKFADADLIGIPHRLVLGERGLADGVIEYRNRRTGEEAKVLLGDVVPALRERLEAT